MYRECEILDEDQKWWNESVIDEAFDAKTASAIKQMPLSNINTPDVLWWKETNSGEYTVSSAYKLELRRQKAEGESSNVEESRWLW